tara:strand:- start:479 stop:580 length:102 start_codon:yes stop_codon:yes gene_type:complete
MVNFIKLSNPNPDNDKEGNLEWELEKIEEDNAN